MVDTHHTSTIGWRSVLLASAVSILGDQLAKVALSVLVFNRTGSAALTAITFGLTLVPELLGGVTLGGLADRYPRRTVMVACAATQATLVAVMALPGMPFVVLAVAVAGVSALAAPARAAQNAVAFELLGPDRFSAGQALLTMLSESGQLLGLAVGAGVVAAVGTSGALVGDAVSFAGAALVLWFGMAATTNPASARTAPPHPEDTTRGGTRTAWRTIRADPTLRIMSWLVTLVALGAVPSGIMAPLVHEMHRPTWWVGILLAADSAGLVVAAWVVRRIPARRHAALIGPLTLATFVPLVFFFLTPGPAGAVALLAVCGAAQAYLPLTKGVFGERINGLAPAAATSAYALVGVSMRAAQGVAVMAGGAVVLLIGSPARTIGVVGVLGLALAAMGAWRWRTIRAHHMTMSATADVAAP